MKRRDVLAGVVLLLATGRAALAEDFVAAIVRDLQSQGYAGITTERTLLGRVRIVAESATARREIILNPRTGEILRDLWMALDGTVVADGRGRGEDEDEADGAGSEDDDDTDDDSEEDDGDDSADDSSDDSSDDSDDSSGSDSVDD